MANTKKVLAKQKPRDKATGSDVGLDLPDMTSEEIAQAEQEIVRLKVVAKSLVEFRKGYLASFGDVPSPEFHETWSKILLHEKRHFAIEAFRESAKTQIVLRANLLHALAFPMERRSYLVIICSNQRTASKKLQEISREFASNPVLQGATEKVIEDSGMALEIQCQSRYECKRVRIEAYGKGSAVRGLSWGAKRPDLVIIDDPQDEEDARSESTTETDWDWFLSDVMFLGQSTRIFLIGNNLGERCIIEQVLKHAKQLKFKTQRIPILSEKGESAWPEKWPVAAIERDKQNFAEIGKLDIWYRNKMCECISPESQKFRKDMFRYYNDWELNKSDLSIYTTVDLAVSLKANADYTAVVTVGVNRDSQWFVLDVDYGKYTPIDQIDAIFHAVQTWRPITVGIEGVAYQRALKDFLEHEMPKRNVFFRIEAVHSGEKKELRIDTMQPRFAIGSVWFKRDAPWVGKIQEELLSYPHGAHDDCIDALAYMEQLATPPMTGGLIRSSGRRWEDIVPIAGQI